MIKLIKSLLLIVGFLFVEVSFIWASEATVRLETDKMVVSKGDQVKIRVVVESDRETLGTDVVLNYNSEVLELVEVVSGDIYPNNSDVSLDKFSKGKVNFSGVSSISKGVVPSGILVTVEFKAIGKGNAEIEAVYEKGSTTGTGIIPFEGSEDNLISNAPEPVMIEVEGGVMWPVSVKEAGELGLWAKLWMWIRGLFS